MILLPSSVRVYAAVEPVNLKKSFEGFRTKCARYHFARLLASAVRTSGLRVEGMNLDDMLDALARAAALQELSAQVNALKMRIDDTIDRERSDAWETFIAFYRVATAVASVKKELAVEIEPIVEFLTPTKKKTAKNSDEEAVTPKPQPEPAPAPAPVKVVNG